MQKTKLYKKKHPKIDYIDKIKLVFLSQKMVNCEL